MTEFEIKMLELMQSMVAKLESLDEKLNKSAAIPTSPTSLPHMPSIAPMLSELPSLHSIPNLELTFWDNGRTQGKARFKLQAEINMSRTKEFTKRRDGDFFAELSPPYVFMEKLRTKIISDDYRDMLDRCCDFDNGTTLLGMFGARGGRGTGGIQWFDRQFVVVTHDGSYNATGAVLTVGSESFAVDDFRTVHPHTNKPFGNPKVKAKAIAFPSETLGLRVVEAA